MVCRNICLRLYASTLICGSHYTAGGNSAEDVNAILLLQRCFLEFREILFYGYLFHPEHHSHIVSYRLRLQMVLLQFLQSFDQRVLWSF
jgi:hypothetical protein